MTIICLEGPDLAGKSTLADRLTTHYGARDHKVTQLKRGPIVSDVLSEYLRPFDHHPVDEVLILDRWHVGELIYGPLLRGRSRLTVAQSNYIEMVMQSLGCRFIHVTAHINTLYDRYDIRADELIKREWLPEIQESYWRYVGQRSHWVSGVVNGANDTIFPNTLDQPSTDLQYWRGRYVGPSMPRVLLLGDERANDSYTWPFVPAAATSGHWLMGALWAAKVDHMQVGMINACEQHPTELNALWGVLGRPPVVTLGRNAEKAWRVADPGLAPPGTYLHHPQYARRFHYTSFEDYGNEIKKVMR